MIALLGVVIGLIILMSYFWLYRNIGIYRMRMRLLGQISAAANADEARGDFYGFMWRLKLYESVTYNEQVNSFKRIKPESWWDDLSFIDPSATGLKG